MVSEKDFDEIFMQLFREVEELKKDKVTKDEFIKTLVKEIKRLKEQGVQLPDESKKKLEEVMKQQAELDNRQAELDNRIEETDKKVKIVKEVVEEELTIRRGKEDC